MNGPPQRTLGEAIADMDLRTAAAIAGLLLVAIGSLGPWATTPLSSASGLDGDGKLTIVLAALAAAGLFTRRSAGAAIACLLIVGVGVYDAIHLHHVLGRYEVLGYRYDSVGWGVYAVIAGAAITLAALYRARRQSVRRTLRGWVSKK